MNIVLLKVYQLIVQYLKGALMKRELILSALLLSSPVATTFHLHAQELISSASLETDHLVGTMFVSKVQKIVPYGDHEQAFQGYVQIKFYNEQNFSWNAENTELPPTIALAIDVFDENGEITYYNGGNFYFAKRVKENLYRLYDCDSTSTCRSESFSEFYIFNTPDGRIIKAKSKDLRIKHFYSKTFLEV